MSTSAAQMDLLEYGAREAMRLREVGMALVLDHDTEYRDQLLSAIEVLAMHGDPFTADDARAMVGDPPPDVNPKIAGAVFNAAAKVGIIRFSGVYAISTRAIGHGNLVRVWVGAK